MKSINQHPFSQVWHEHGPHTARFTLPPLRLDVHKNFSVGVDRHGPKPGCHEAEAFTILEAEASTLFNLEAEAEALV